MYPLYVPLYVPLCVPHVCTPCVYPWGYIPLVCTPVCTPYMYPCMYPCMNPSTYCWQHTHGQTEIEPHTYMDRSDWSLRYDESTRLFELLVVELAIKCTFLYSAVSSPWDGSRRFTLHPWQTCSFSGKHSATQQLLREDYLFTYPPLSIARYSCIQLS